MPLFLKSFVAAHCRGYYNRTAKLLQQVADAGSVRLVLVENWVVGHFETVVHV